MDLLEELTSRVVLADGAMGTELFAAGITGDQCLEELCVSAPETVSRIHAAYIAAGAEVIRTNSFGASAARLARFGFERRVSEFNWSAAQLAKASAKGHGVLVAGSVGPLGSGVASPTEKRRLFEDQIGALLDGGAQLIILETFQDMEEMLLAIEVKNSLHHCPVVGSFTCGSSDCLLDGTPLHAAWAQARAADADIVGANCTARPTECIRLFEGAESDQLFSAFPSAGLPPHLLSPREFANLCEGLVARGVRLIGGCCGTTPAHLAALASALAPPEKLGAHS